MLLCMSMNIGIEEQKEHKFSFEVHFWKIASHFSGMVFAQHRLNQFKVCDLASYSIQNAVPPTYLSSLSLSLHGSPGFRGAMHTHSFLLLSQEIPGVPAVSKH